MDIDMCIEAMKRKDASALEGIMNEYGKLVYALAYRILNGLATKEDVEECVSDVFVSIWNDINDYSKLRGSFKTWILINKLDREIFIRRYFYYEKIEDIAKRKGLTRQAVDSRLFRMRAKLKGLEVV